MDVGLFGLGLRLWHCEGLLVLLQLYWKGQGT